MKIFYPAFCFIAAALLFAACKDPFMPEIRPLDKEIIVVDGFIDGADETLINISRVRPLGKADSAFQPYVTNAIVFIEDDIGNSYPLSGGAQGKYRGRYNLNPNPKYRISIEIGPRKYASDFVQYKVSPAIESVSYTLIPEGARIYLNTKDPSNRSRYYRWKYDETWQIRSFYESEYMYDPVKNAVVDLTDSIRDCWQFDRSRDILIKTSQNLQSDVMNDVPLVVIPYGSIKLSVLYSIKVKQFVMDSVGYNYYHMLKKNTEETGSIFDPQPGNLRGNLHNVDDPEEIVVGYVGAGSSYETRKFFKIPWDYREDCQDRIFVVSNPDSLKFYFGNGGYYPLYQDFDGPVEGWNAAFKNCVDCRIRGTNIKPPYWP